MKRVLAASVAALLTVSLVSSVAVAAPKATNLWSVYNINAGGAAYTPKAAPGTTTSAANFTFTSQPTTALLTTSKDKTLLGDLTGKTLTATFTIAASTDAAFNYAGTCGSTPASVRLYFAGDTTGKFTQDTAGYSKYWWSNPLSYTLAGSTFTLIVPLDTSNWSDWGGQLASDVPAYFATAVTQVSAVGLSFGGGCFFANGVGMSAGSASFSLTSYSVTPTL
jgi:hypothetical protein